MTKAPKTETLRVTYITEAAGGGVRRHLNYVIPELLANNVDVQLIASMKRAEPGYREDLDQLAASGCRIVSMHMSHAINPAKDMSSILQIRRELQKFKPHVVHTHSEKAGLLGRIAASHLQLRHQAAVVHSPHAFFFQRFTSGLTRFALTGLERGLSNLTDKYVLVSNAEAAAAQNICGLPTAKLQVIENGIPVHAASEYFSRDLARTRLNIGKDDFAICVPGRLAYQKGQDVLIEAICHDARLQSNRFRFHFCGGGPSMAEFQQEYEKTGLNTQVVFNGFINDLPKLLPAFDLVLLLARYEALPYILLESLTARVPLLVTDIPSHFPRPEMRHLLPSVPLGSEGALAKAILDLSENREKLQTQVQSFTDFVKINFPLDKQVQQLVRCYKDIVPAGMNKDLIPG